MSEVKRKSPDKPLCYIKMKVLLFLLLFFPLIPLTELLLSVELGLLVLRVIFISLFARWGVKHHGAVVPMLRAR